MWRSATTTRLRVTSMPSEFEELFGEWGLDGNGQPIPLSVEPYLGVGAIGPKFGAPIDHAGLIQLPQEKLVRTAQGDEAVSSALVYAPLDVAGDFPLGSRVTLADGRRAAVLTIGKPDVYGMLGFVVLNLE